MGAERRARRAQVRRVVGEKSDFNLANHLRDAWLASARAHASGDGTVDLLAVICAAEMVKLSMIAIGERGYAAQGPEAVEVFQADIERALATIQYVPPTVTS